MSDPFIFPQPPNRGTFPRRNDSYTTGTVSSQQLQHTPQANYTIQPPSQYPTNLSSAWHKAPARYESPRVVLPPPRQQSEPVARKPSTWNRIKTAFQPKSPSISQTPFGNSANIPRDDAVHRHHSEPSRGIPSDWTIIPSTPRAPERQRNPWMNTPRPRQPTAIRPPTTELGLHPLLRHKVQGDVPLVWHLGCKPHKIQHRSPRDPSLVTVLPAASRMEMMSNPPVTSFRISGIGDDTWKLPWPVVLHDAGGIRLQQIFEAVSKHFRKFVTRDQYQELSSSRKHQTDRAYHVRRDAQMEFEDTTDCDGLRRLDILGERLIFRGLELSPEGDGSFLIFLGPDI